MQNTSIFDHDTGSFKTRYKKGIKKKKKKKKERKKKGRVGEEETCSIYIYIYGNKKYLHSICILINAIYILIILSFVSYLIFLREKFR